MKPQPCAEKNPATGSATQNAGLIVAGAGIHLLYLGSLYTGWLNLFFNDSSHTRQGFDFAVFYLAGRALEAGQDIYRLQAAFGFRYLPAFALVFGRFFTSFTLHTGYLVYLFITELILLANLWLTWKWGSPASGGPTSRQRALAIFMWLSFSPYYLELYMGQVSFWAASLLFFLCYALERPLPAALCWTAAVLIKPNALILAPAFIRLRQFGALGFGLLAILLTSIPYFLLHSGSLQAFLELNLGTRHFKGALTHAGNLGLWGTLISLSAKFAGLPLAELNALEELPVWSRSGTLVILASILAFSLFATFASRNPQPRLLYSLWLTTYFLLYKDVWEHHYVFLLPVLVVLQLSSFSPKLLFIFFFLAIPTPYILFDVSPGIEGNIDPERLWHPLVSLFYRGFKLVPVFALWLWLLDQLRNPAGPMPIPDHQKIGTI